MTEVISGPAFQSDAQLNLQLLSLLSALALIDASNSSSRCAISSTSKQIVSKGGLSRFELIRDSLFANTSVETFENLDDKLSRSSSTALMSSLGASFASYG